MNDTEYRDFCAAAALSGLLARLDEDDDSLRHHYHVLCLEAFRAAEEMVEVRQAADARRNDGRAKTP